MNDTIMVEAAATSGGITTFVAAVMIQTSTVTTAPESSPTVTLVFGIGYFPFFFGGELVPSTPLIFPAFTEA
jgi:hypothetical protein